MRFYSTLLFLIFGLCINISAQSIKYIDGDSLKLYGKAIDYTSARYERLPKYLKSKLAPKIWNLSRNSAGLYFRFRTNSNAIYLKWENTFFNSMNHFTPLAIRGFDLYILKNNKWYFANSARPSMNSPKSDAMIIGSMDGKMKECMLYFPLYDGVKNVELGIDSNAVILKPQYQYPNNKKIVIYGTSILQGACASRPGMASTAILGRKLGYQIINLGFSGSAKLEPEMADFITQISNPSVIVLDFLPNVTIEMVKTMAEPFFQKIRNKFTNTPIVFVENPNYSHSEFDLVQKNNILNLNKELHKIYLKLKQKGDNNIYYVKGDKLVSPMGESTVDGIHSTDIGMENYANILEKTLRKIIKN